MLRPVLISTIKVAATIIVLLASGASSIRAQDSTPKSEAMTRAEEEKAQADADKAKADARKAAADADKAELEAKFPKPTSSPLAGTTTINDGAVIESEMVSYLSMAYAANRIIGQLKAAEQVGNNKKITIANLAIYNQADVNLLLNYNVTNSQLDVMRQRYCDILAPNLEPKLCPAPKVNSKGSRERALTTALPIIDSFLGAFVDLTALLRTNVDIKGHTFAIDEAALVSEVFRAARNPEGLTHNPNLYYPAAFTPNINVNTTSEFLGRLQDLYRLRKRVEAIIAHLLDDDKKIKKAKGELDKLNDANDVLDEKLKAAREELSRLNKLKGQYGSKTPFETIRRIAELEDLIRDLEAEKAQTEKKIKDKKDEIAGLEAARDKHLQELQTKLQDPDNLDDTLVQLKAVNDQFDKFIDSLVKVDSNTGINSLTAYVKAEKINSVLNDANSYWLQLDVVKAGGNNRIKTNLVADIFRGGNRVSHSGGVIVQYNLYDLNGRSILSDTLTEYTGYIKAGKIKNLLNPVGIGDLPPRKPAHP